MPTRYNDIGLAGRLPGAEDTAQRSARPAVSDPYLRQYVIELPLVASAAEQDTGFTMPDNALSAVGFLRIRTASTGGTAETIDIGIVGGSGDELLDGEATDALGLFDTVQGVDLSGENIGYTLGAADITGLECELVLTVLCSDV